MEDKREGRTGAARLVAGAALLALLGVSALAGARRETARAVSVPVERQTVTATGEGYAPMSAAERLARDRQEEIALLDAVLSGGAADAETRQSALRQKAELAERMEREAEARACLTAMGVEDAQAVCGAGMLTVVLPAAQAGDAQRAAALVCAVAEQTGTEPENVKLLLTR